MDLDASQADSGQGSGSADPGSGAPSAAGWGGGYGPYGPGYPLWSYPDLASNRLLYPPKVAADGSGLQSDVPPTEIDIVRPIDLIPQGNRVPSPANPRLLSTAPHLLEQIGNMGYQPQWGGDVGGRGRQNRGDGHDD